MTAQILKPDFPKRIREIELDMEQIERLARGGGGGDNGGMEPRIKALETAIITVGDRLTKIETRLEYMPTKADLEAIRTDVFKAIGAQTWKFVSAISALVAVVYFIAKSIH